MTTEPKDYKYESTKKVVQKLEKQHILDAEKVISVEEWDRSTEIKVAHDLQTVLSEFNVTGVWTFTEQDEVARVHIEMYGRTVKIDLIEVEE